MIVRHKQTVLRQIDYHTTPIFFIFADNFKLKRRQNAKITFFILFCTLGYATLFAQTDKDKATAFQVGFVPPLSSNGIQGYKYTNGVSLNLLAGISKNDRVD